MIARKAKMKTVMGLAIMPTQKNAKKFAADLDQLQGSLFRQTDKIDYLDQNSTQGHLNYELNKFGIALEAAIKLDIRANPRQSLLEFYVNVLAACYENKNYELAPRILNGINNAIRMDEADLLIEEDAEKKQLRQTIKTKLTKVKQWQRFCDIEFPMPAKCKALFQNHVECKEKFIPSIQALMNFIAIRLDNAGSCLRDLAAEEITKIFRIAEMKHEIYADLFFIGHLIGDCLPERKGLNFKLLAGKFSTELILNLAVPAKSLDALLDDIVQLRKLSASFRNSFKGAAVSESGLSQVSLFAKQSSSESMASAEHNSNADVLVSDQSDEEEATSEDSIDASVSPSVRRLSRSM